MRGFLEGRREHLRLAWRYLWARPLGRCSTWCCWVLGLGPITFLLLVAHQLESAFERDLAGIDLVVGSQGQSPQLILSGVLQSGRTPPAMCRWRQCVLQRNPLVAQSSP